MSQPAPPSMSTALILWFAILSSTFIFLGVGLFAAPTEASYDATIAIVLTVAAMGSAVMSFVLPTFLHRQALSATELEILEEPDPTSEAESMYRDQVAMRRIFADPDAARAKATAVFYTPFILGCALSESVAIFGLVLLFLGAPPMHALPLFLISWILMGVRFPTLAKVVGPFETSHSAKIVDRDRAATE